ncbi:MAG TPA: Gfo/Idh/MocA family oxidoreductase [Ruminiclostridium sp.]
MKENYKLAIVGYGGMGSQHSRLLKDVPNISISGIFDISEGKQAEARENGLKSYHSFEDILKDDTVDIVLIATPNHLHKNIAVKALDAGKHVICEKPVALSSDELAEIIDAADRNKRIFVVHQNRRWDEDYLVMKKILDEKIIGEIYNVESRVIGSRGIPGDWRHEKQYGGGMMLDWGVHLIDRVLVMIDDKIEKIYCRMSYILGNDVDDGFQLMLDFKSGKTAFVEVQTNNYISLPLWYMAGSNGTAAIDDWDMGGNIATLTKYDDKDAKPIEAGAGLTKTMAPRGEDTVEIKPIFRLDSDVKDFYMNVLNTIEGKEEIIVKNTQVMRVMKVIEAAFKSSELHQTVDFE